MTYLLARLDAAITRVVTCVADKVFDAIDTALFTWPEDEDGVLYPQWKMTGPGHFTIDGADRLSDWEAEHEVHEPPPVNCPVGGQCPNGCDRTHAGCHTIWGNDTDHAEAVERNRYYTSMKDPVRVRTEDLGFGDLTIFDGDGTSHVIPAGEWCFLEPIDDTQPNTAKKERP